MRYHLIDRIEEICYGKYITGVKCVTFSDDVFNDHFPGHPIFPGALILEALAQLSGSFFELTIMKKNLPLRRCILSMADRMKFRRPVLPGDKILLRADLVSMHEDSGRVNVKAEVDGEKKADGELTFIFLDIKDDSLHQARLDLYNIYMRNAKEII